MACKILEFQQNIRENLSFKEEEAQEKVTVGSWHNWNTLFMGGSAMVDVMVRGYNRSKQDELHPCPDHWILFLYILCCPAG
ncbi:uncharacterized protein LOC135100723 isoform X3 [Scylla paramamosain]|uniref:uncharacterized protein LOC135100723 isoform X3 n=1 Tax=Scylla paramamosain TaxID=85552 RepID=UPI003082F7C9